MDHLKIDVVPAVIHDERKDWIYVPDTRKGSWIASAPAIHQAGTSAVNQKCAETFKPLVRLLKGWNGSLPSTAQFKSFAVESIAARALDARPRATLSDGMLSFFDFVAWRGGHESVLGWREDCGVKLTGWGSPSLPDIAGTGANILANANADLIAKFCTAARVMRDVLVEARAARDAGSAWARVEPRLRGGLARV